jgi:hypothetical protein
VSYKTYDERMAAKRARKPNRKQRRAMLMQIRRSMQTVGNRLLKRVQHRREMDGADWLKQMRRQQRTLSEARPPRTPEQKAAIAIKNKDDDPGPMVKRYKSLPTPEQLEEQRQKRAKDTRSSKRK